MDIEISLNKFLDPLCSGVVVRGYDTVPEVSHNRIEGCGGQGLVISADVPRPPKVEAAGCAPTRGAAERTAGCESKLVKPGGPSGACLPSPSSVLQSPGSASGSSSPGAPRSPVGPAGASSQAGGPLRPGRRAPTALFYDNVEVNCGRFPMHGVHQDIDLL